jgi:hypothetical protein
MVEFGFAAHVADGVCDGAGVDFGGDWVIMIPIGLDEVDDGGDEVVVFVEGVFGGFLEEDCAVDEVEVVFVVGDYFVQLLRCLGVLDE